MKNIFIALLLYTSYASATSNDGSALISFSTHGELVQLDINATLKAGRQRQFRLRLSAEPANVTSHYYESDTVWSRISSNAQLLVRAASSADCLRADASRHALVDTCDWRGIFVEGNFYYLFKAARRGAVGFALEEHELKDVEEEDGEGALVDSLYEVGGKFCCCF